MIALIFGMASVISVTDARIRPIPPTLSTTAGYFTVRNSSSKPDALTKTACACAADVTAHESTETGGMASMRASGAVVVPAHGSVTFAPEGRHLMLMGVRGGVRSGQRVKLVLTFARAGRVPVTFIGRN
jgi:copper(I)-binding protein